MHHKLVFCLLCLAFLLPACAKEKDKGGQSPGSQNTPRPDPVPDFNEDTAFAFIEKQLSFGPRVPGSEAHSQAADFLFHTLIRFGGETERQKFNARRFDGTRLQGTNIIGRFGPEEGRRLLLAAHWDSRFTSDQAATEEEREMPVPGADDGASGVAVLLELARLMDQNPPPIGVDILFLDLEDQGEPGGSAPESWCLGAQHWSENPHRPVSEYRYGILLDMVGSEGARFAREGVSLNYAPDIVDKIWNMARQMGYNHLFVDERTGAVLDDHLYINRDAGVRMINIINRQKDTELGFGHYWHTPEDDLDIISKPTLRAVGKVMAKAVYSEKES